jgi:hypothetical protein
MIHIDEPIARELRAILLEMKHICRDLLGDSIVAFKRIPRLMTRIENVLNKMEGKDDEKKDNTSKQDN